MLCHACMHQIPEGSTVCPVCKSNVPCRKEWSEDLMPGTRLQNGRFIMGRALGHGGFGITYIAYDTRLETIRTIKEYFPRTAKRNQNNCPMIRPEDVEVVQRNKEHFLHEARMVTRASKADYVMKAFDQFDENGTSYIVLEYLDGMTVDDYMQRTLRSPFPWEDAVRYVMQALEGLQSLHDLGILHRDISCNNIFLLKNDEIRIIDLGSAESIEDARMHPEKLWPSRKKSYTPSEQRSGMIQGPASDVYAMSVVLFKMITGKAPAELEGRTLPPVASVNPGANVPGELDQILADGTRERMADRIQTAAEFRERLRPLIGDGEEKPKRSSRVVILAVAGIAALAVGATVLLTRGQPAPDAPEYNPIAVVTADPSWKAPKLAFEDGAAARSVKRNGVFQLEMEGEPEKNLTLRMEDAEGNARELLFAYQLDGEGKNRQEIQVASLELAPGEYRMTAGYAGTAGDGTVSEALGLTVLDEDVKQPTLSIYGGNTQAGPNQEITLSGQGEPGEQMMLASVGSRKPKWTLENIRADGSWSFTRNISELLDDSEQEQITLEVSYARDTYAGLKSEPLTMTIQRKIREIQIDGRITYRTAEIAGRGEPEAQLTVKDGEGNVVAGPVNISRDGDFYLSGLDLTGVSQLVFTERNQNLGIEGSAACPVWVKPTLGFTADGNASVMNLTLKDEKIEISGTASPDLPLTLQIDDAEEEVTSEADGTWRKTLALEKYAGEVGSVVRRQIRIRYAQEEDTWADTALQLNIDNPVFRVPTLAFRQEDGGNGTESGTEGSMAGGTESGTAGGMETGEKILSETGTASLEGTAEPGETLILTLAEDSSWRKEIYAEADGTWQGVQVRAAELLALDRGNRFHLRLGYEKQPEVTAERELTLEIDQGVESARITGTLTDRTKEISGTAEAGATVEILSGDGENERLLGRGTAGQDNKFTVSDLDLSECEGIRVRVTDRTGHRAESTEEVWKIPTLRFQGTDEKQITLGKQGRVTLRIEAGTKKRMQLTLENARGIQRSVTTDASGGADIPLDAEADADFLPQGMETYVLRASYDERTDLRTETLILSVDREAEAILTGRTSLEDGDTEISGTAERGAELTLTGTDAEGQEKLLGGPIRADGQDGSFRFEGLDLFGFTQITLREKDGSGNETESILPVREGRWQAIQPETWLPGETYTYGPGNRPEALEGRAEPGKELKAAWEGGEEIIPVAGDGTWRLSPVPAAMLPEEDGWAGSVNLTYASGRGDAVTLRFRADYACEEPRVAESEIYADTPEMTLQVEKGSSVTVNGGESYTDADGNREIVIPLAQVEGLAENTEMIIVSEDPYGNRAEITVAVAAHRDEMYGYFDNRNLDRTYALGEDVILRAYIYAGNEVRIIDAGFDILDEEGKEILSLSSTSNGSGLKTLNVEKTVDRKKLPEGFQADQGRQCDITFPSAGNLLNGRAYRAQIWVSRRAGEKIPVGEPAAFRYGTDDPWHIGNATDGYFMGLDEPEGGCVLSQNTLWFTGYYYSSPDAGEEEDAGSKNKKKKTAAVERVTKASITLYYDENCTEQAGSRDNIAVEKKDCVARNRESALWQGADWEPDTKASGFIIWSSSNKKNDEINQLPDGVYWARVVCTARNPGEFAPLRVELRSGENPGKKSDVLKRNSAGWVE